MSLQGVLRANETSEDGLAAYRVSPLSARGYLLYRGISAYILSLVGVLLALTVIGLVQIPPAVLVGSGAVGVLSGPAIALVFGTVASNTIEGIAISKLINLVILGLAVGIVVVSEPLQFAAGVLRTYWSMKAVVSGVAGEALWPVIPLIGVVVHLLVILVSVTGSPGGPTKVRPTYHEFVTISDRQHAFTGGYLRRISVAYILRVKRGISDDDQGDA